MQALDFTIIISAVYWLTVAYVAYVIYKKFDELGLLRPARQAYWLLRQWIWEKQNHEE